MARLEERLEGLRARGARGVVVLDAALLLEWGLERDCDAVIAVTAPQAEQVRRLMRGAGLDGGRGAAAALAGSGPTRRSPRRRT